MRPRIKKPPLKQFQGRFFFIHFLSSIIFMKYWSFASFNFRCIIQHRNLNVSVLIHAASVILVGKSVIYIQVYYFFYDTFA